MRKKIPTPCKECNDRLTTTKYCDKCRKIVHLRQNRMRAYSYNETKKAKILEAANCDTKARYKGTVNKKWLVRGLVSANTRECAITAQA